MKTSVLGRVAEPTPRDAAADASPRLVDAVSALLFGVTLGAPALRVVTSTPLESACREAAEGAASLESAPHTHVSARALSSNPASDARTAEGPSPAAVEALVRLAATRSTQGAQQPAACVAVAAPTPAASPSAPEASGSAPRVAVPALLSAHAAQVDFGEGGADATIEIAHPVLGPIRLALSLSTGGVALRALTPSTATAAALRALEPTIARALSARGLSLRSLRVGVGSDSRATVSRAQRRRRDFEEEA